MPLIALVVAVLLAAPRGIHEGTVVAPAALAVGAEPLPTVTYPVDGYGKRISLKGFGQWVDDGRFFGYHLGEDAEFGDVPGDVAVRAIADGTVLHAGWVKGYGGMMLVRHDIGGRRVNAIYGHLDPATLAAKEGATVRAGEKIAILGDAFTAETDGRRKHLHFALYEGDGKRFEGYTLDQSDLGEWLDPKAVYGK